MVFDPKNQQTQITNPQSKVMNLAFDPLGRKTYVSKAAYAISQYAYDIAGRLSSILNTNGTGSTISSLTYAYDNAGTRTGQAEADGTLTTWTYDATNQLTREQRSGADGFDISYAYDAAGNRTVQTAGSAITTSVYDNANRLLTATTGTAITTYIHDAAGNRQEVHHPDTTVDYFTWDPRSLMVVANAGGNTVTNTFNAPGQRVAKGTSGGTTHFRYDGKNLIQETDSSNDLTASYTTTDEEYGDLISEHDFIDGGLGTGEFYQQFDAQYAANAMVDDSGSVVQKYQFKAFGLPAPAAIRMAVHGAPRQGGGKAA